MKNYHREFGDDLFNKDQRLKYYWAWSRSASCFTTKQLKNWTHFQVSFCDVGDWMLKVVQHPEVKGVSYAAVIKYKGNIIVWKKEFKTRLDAQIGAEKLLVEWVREQYKVYGRK